VRAVDDVLRVLVFVVAGANPMRAALALRPGSPEGARALTGAVVLGYTLVALAAWGLAAVSGPMLDGLDISPESFRVGGGIVLALGGARLAVMGLTEWDDVPPAWRSALVPIAFPVLLAPELVAVAVGLGADEGAGPVLLAAVVAGILGTLAFVAVKGRPGPSAGATCRLVGGVAVVCGTAYAIDGIFAL
jgi:small neutral amino acid transporter SnatA (MarC family)